MEFRITFVVLLTAALGEALVDLSIFSDHSEREMKPSNEVHRSDAMSKLEKYQIISTTTVKPEEERVYRAAPPGRPRVPVSTAWSSGPVQPAFRGKFQAQDLPKVRRPVFSQLRIRPVPIKRKQKVHVPPVRIPATELALERTPHEVVINDIHLVEGKYLPETEEVARARLQHLKYFPETEEMARARLQHPDERKYLAETEEMARARLQHLVEGKYLPETEEVARARLQHLKIFEAERERNSHPVV